MDIQDCSEAHLACSEDRPLASALCGSRAQAAGRNKHPALAASDREFPRQIVFCAAARTPLTVDVRRVEEQGVANLAVALQVGSPAEASYWMNLVQRLLHWLGASAWCKPCRPVTA